MYCAPLKVLTFTLAQFAKLSLNGFRRIGKVCALIVPLYMYVWAKRYPFLPFRFPYNTFHCVFLARRCAGFQMNSLHVLYDRKKSLDRGENGSGFDVPVKWK